MQLKRLIDAGSRLSRAAMFVAAAACYANPPQPHAPDDTVETSGAQEYAPAPVEEEPIPGTGALEGTARDSTGAPLAGEWVILKGPDGEQKARVDGRGRYKFSNLPPGDYMVHTVWKADTRIAPAKKDVEVSADETANADLVILLLP